MTDTTSTGDTRLTLLVVARHPFRPEDVGLEAGNEVAQVRLIRRLSSLEAAIDELDPNVLLIDTGFPERHGFEAIETALALAPGAAVLALTPNPPPYQDVALATRAGVSGFIDVDAEAHEFGDAVRTVVAGGTWFPSEEVRPVLTAVAGDLDETTAARRSHLNSILLGLIPLTGLLAALMTYLWRKYLGKIGVRPVDLAIDPASRIVDAIAALLLLFGVLGPLLLIGTWLDLLRASPAGRRPPMHRILQRNRTAHLVLTLVWLGFAWIISWGPEPLLVLVAGPLMAIAVIARSADSADELPPFLRIKIRPRRLLIGCLTALLLVLAALGAETILVGPVLGPRGESGVLVPRMLGFNAQPMLAIPVAGDSEPREVLYLGGNADLYVLVDPCNDNQIELVSVAAHRLVVIDEVTCTTADD